MIVYLKSAGPRCCPVDGQCLSCSIDEVCAAIRGLADAFETFFFVWRRSRASGSSSFAIRPWKWQRSGFRRNRSFRARKVVRCRVLRWKVKEERC